MLYRCKHDEEFGVAPPHSGWAHDPALEPEAAQVAPSIATLHAAHTAGALSDVAFVAGYILVYAHARNRSSPICGRRQKPIRAVVAQQDLGQLGWAPVDCTLVAQLPGVALSEAAKAKLRRWHEPRGEAVTVGALFAEWQLQGVPLYAATSIACWAAGRRPLRLVFHIPSVDAVLRMQCGAPPPLAPWSTPHTYPTMPPRLAFCPGAV
jgi:hypothetical protein